jgi:hypothetical protein
MLIGGVYGSSLTVVGVLLAGAGHGTYGLLGVASAPLSFLGIKFSFVGPLLLWTTLGGLLAYSSKAPHRQIVAVALIVHYVAILLLPFFGDYADGKYIGRAWHTNPVMIVAGATLYLLGQVTLWLYWLRQGKSKDKSTD